MGHKLELDKMGCVTVENTSSHTAWYIGLE